MSLRDIFPHEVGEAKSAFILHASALIDLRGAGLNIGGDVQACGEPPCTHAFERAVISVTEHPRIVLDPKVVAGKPVIRGTRIAVEFVIGLLADGWAEDAIVENYPGITRDDILACLAYARDTLSSEKVFPSAA